jgi:hypothetical protein
MGTPLRALRGLGVQTGTRRRGRDGSHGHSRVIPFQGIGSTVRDRPGGEVTSREVDGGVLAMLGCPRWAWQWPGRREVLAWCLCEVGSWWGPREGGDRLLGVRGGSRSKDRGRGRRTGRGLRLPLLPSMPNEKRQGEKFS